MHCPPPSRIVLTNLLYCPRLSPDDQQQRLTGHLAGQEEHEALEQRPAHRGLVVDVDAQCPAGRLLALLAVVAFVVIAALASGSGGGAGSRGAGPAALTAASAQHGIEHVVTAIRRAGVVLLLVFVFVLLVLLVIVPRVNAQVNVLVVVIAVRLAVNLLLLLVFLLYLLGCLGSALAPLGCLLGLQLQQLLLLLL